MLHPGGGQWYAFVSGQLGKQGGGTRRAVGHRRVVGGALVGGPLSVFNAYSFPQYTQISVPYQPMESASDSITRAASAKPSQSANNWTAVWVLAMQQEGLVPAPVVGKLPASTVEGVRESAGLERLAEEWAGVALSGSPFGEGQAMGNAMLESEWRGEFWTWYIPVRQVLCNKELPLPVRMVSRLAEGGASCVAEVDREGVTVWHGNGDYEDAWFARGRTRRRLDPATEAPAMLDTSCVLLLRARLPDGRRLIAGPHVFASTEQVTALTVPLRQVQGPRASVPARQWHVTTGDWRDPAAWDGQDARLAGMTRSQLPREDWRESAMTAMEWAEGKQRRAPYVPGLLPDEAPSHANLDALVQCMVDRLGKDMRVVRTQHGGLLHDWLGLHEDANSMLTEYLQAVFYAPEHCAEPLTRKQSLYTGQYAGETLCVLVPRLRLGGATWAAPGELVYVLERECPAEALVEVRLLRLGGDGAADMRLVAREDGRVLHDGSREWRAWPKSAFPLPREEVGASLSGVCAWQVRWYGRPVYADRRFLRA